MEHPLPGPSHEVLVVPRPMSSGGKATHLRRPKMKAWKRLRLLLSGARRLTWLYRDPIDCVQEPEDRGRRQPGPGPVPTDPTASQLTWLHRCLHHAPRAAPALPRDEVLPEWLQSIGHQSMEGRAEGGQHQMPHIRAQPAIPQLGLGTAQSMASHRRPSVGAPFHLSPNKLTF